MPTVSFTQVYVVEYQKCGLLHAHILLTVAPKDKPACPDDVGRLISAEILDQTTNPLGYDTITRFMIHDPCVLCLTDGKCSKCHPKRFCNQTAFDEHGFAQCQRRRTPPQAVANGQEIDNQWLVPYNRDLCIKYDAHISVKHVAVRSMMKYLYKYVHKDNDRTTIVIEGNTAHHEGEQPQQVATYLQLSHVVGFLSSA